MITPMTITPTKAMTTPTDSRQRSYLGSALITVALLASACASSVALPETSSAEDAAVQEVEVEVEEAEADTGADNAAENSADVAVEGEVEVEEAETDSGADDAADASAQESSEEATEPGTDTSIEEVAFSDLCNAEPAIPGARVDVDPSGNRIAPGSIDFTEIDEIAVELPDEGIWVTADTSVPGGWYVVLERGSAVRVAPDGVVTSSAGPGAVPPEFDAAGEIQSPFRSHDLFDDPIDDSRVVVYQQIAAVLSSTTDFLRHGVLGDPFEAAAIEWVDTCSGESGRIEIAQPDVVEGISPMLADIDSDGQTEIIVTLSNASRGARLAAFELDGTSAGESEPIGQGNRWRNQLAAGAFGPNGEVEIIDVRTPHIGGTVQAFRQVVDEDGNPSLIQVAASDPNYTSHVIGTRNLSMGIALNVDADSFPDVVVATADRSAIVAMTRTDDLDAALQGWNIVGERQLTNSLTSNIATQPISTGRSAIAVADGAMLRIWN